MSVVNLEILMEKTHLPIGGWFVVVQLAGALLFNSRRATHCGHVI